MTKLSKQYEIIRKEMDMILHESKIQNVTLPELLECPAWGEKWDKAVNDGLALAKRLSFYEARKEACDMLNNPQHWGESDNRVMDALEAEEALDAHEAECSKTVYTYELEEYELKVRETTFWVDGTLTVYFQDKSNYVDGAIVVEEVSNQGYEVKLDRVSGVEGDFLNEQCRMFLEIYINDRNDLMGEMEESFRVDF